MIFNIGKRKTERLSTEICNISKYSTMSDEVLKTIARSSLSDAELFALYREVIFRVTGKSLYNVQQEASIILTQGRVVEMKTGEGKTLTEVPAALYKRDKGNRVLFRNEV